MYNEKNNIKGIADISGFGEEHEYELGCQNMLQTGYDWLLKQTKKPNLTATTYENVTGLFTPKSKSAKELSKVVGDSDEECTGAMHQAVMEHLFFISANGIDKWEKEVSIK